jgi:hypothetical protein
MAIGRSCVLHVSQAIHCRQSVWSKHGRPASLFLCLRSGDLGHLSPREWAQATALTRALAPDLVRHVWGSMVLVNLQLQECRRSAHCQECRTNRSMRSLQACLCGTVCSKPRRTAGHAVCAHVAVQPPLLHAGGLGMLCWSVDLCHTCMRGHFIARLGQKVCIDAFHKACITGFMYTKDAWNIVPHFRRPTGTPFLHGGAVQAQGAGHFLASMACHLLHSGC